MGRRNIEYTYFSSFYITDIKFQRIQSLKPIIFSLSFSPINMQRIFSSFLIFSSREFPFFLSLPLLFLGLNFAFHRFSYFQYKNLPTPSFYSVFLSGRSFYYKKFITWKSLRIITASITFTLSFTFFHYYFLLPHNNRYLQKY